MQHFIGNAYSILARSSDPVGEICMNQREIKFRAWDKKRGEILYPDYSHSGTIRLFYTGSFGPSEYGYLTFSGQVLRAKRQEVIEDVTGDFEVMQFTGLKDKNGKEIYEGDIVRHANGTVGLVEYRNTGFTVVEKGEHNGMFNTLDDVWEVIGNVWETPELIK